MGEVFKMTQYSVTCDLFPLNLTQYCKEIADTNVFKDVTLVSDDNVEFKTHKALLSCFSQTLRNSFNEDDDLTIVLPGINSGVLQILLHFIYTGNTSFSSVNLEDVMDAGRYLKVEGMTEENVYLQDIDVDEEATLHVKREQESNENVQPDIHTKNDKRIFKLNEKINIMCCQCSFMTKDDLEMKDHIVENHIEEERYCPFCYKKSYPTWKKFRIHMKDVHKCQTRFCNYCEFIAHSVNDLREHMAKIHSNKGSNLKCNVCHRKLPSLRKIQIHTALMHGSRIFKCTECTKSSSRKEDIQIHIEAVHEGVRYDCEFCDYKGTTKSNLKYHISSIHDSQRFFCNKCDVSSTKQSYINRHFKLEHEGFRFKCDECDHTATTAYVIKMHKKKKHDKVFIHCEFCKFKTHTKYNLNKHQQRRHFKAENNISRYMKRKQKVKYE